MKTTFVLRLQSVLGSMLVMRGMMGGCWAKRAKMLRQDRFEHVTPLNDLQLICIVQAWVLSALTMTLNTNLVERLPEYGIKKFMQTETER